METTEKKTVKVLSENKHQNILTQEALTFLAELHLNFNSKRIDLLKKELLNKNYSTKAQNQNSQKKPNQ